MRGLDVKYPCAKRELQAAISKFAENKSNWPAAGSNRGSTEEKRRSRIEGSVGLLLLFLELGTGTE